MDFFNSLTLDLKIMVVAFAGCVLLALFSANRNAEKRYLVVLALLCAAGVYRFNQTTGREEAAISAAEMAAAHPVLVQTKHVPLQSTAAK